MPDKEGFQYPKINEHLCIDCGCVKKFVHTMLNQRQDRNLASNIMLPNIFRTKLL